MSKPVDWDKFKLPPAPEEIVPGKAAVPAQEPIPNLPPAAAAKQEEVGRKEASDAARPQPKPAVKPVIPKKQKQVYTGGGGDFQLERLDGTPVDVDYPNVPALREDPTRPTTGFETPLRVYKTRPGETAPFGSPALADKLTPGQLDIAQPKKPTAYGSPALAEREAARTDAEDALKKKAPQVSPAVAERMGREPAPRQESPATMRMKEEKYYPSPAQITGFAVREAGEKLTGKDLDIAGLMHKLEGESRLFSDRLTYASPESLTATLNERNAAIEKAVQSHADRYGTNRRALEMEAASRGIPLAAMIEAYETPEYDKAVKPAVEVLDAVKKRGIDLEARNRIGNVDINWSSFSPQMWESETTIGVLGTAELQHDDEVVKPGERGYETALQVWNAVEDDGYNVSYITKLANERGGAAKWVQKRVADLTTGVDSSQPDYDAKKMRAWNRAVAEIAAFKTIGLWASPIFMNDLIAPDYSKGLSDRMWDAIQGQREVVGYGYTSEDSKPRIITRAKSAPATFLYAIDIPQQATVGVIEEVAEKGWDQADFAEGAVRGIEDKRDFMQAALQSDWAKPTQVYDAFGQLKLDADGQPVMEGEWKPVVAGGVGFVAAVLFPDLTLYAGKAVSSGIDAYHGLRDARRLNEATNMLEGVIAARAAGATALRDAEKARADFKAAQLRGATRAELDRLGAAESEARQVSKAIFDSAAEQEAKLRGKYKMVADDVDRMDAQAINDLARDNPDVFNRGLARAASLSDELVTLHPSLRRMETKGEPVSDIRAKKPTEVSFEDYDRLFNTGRIVSTIHTVLDDSTSAEVVTKVLRTTAANDLSAIRRVVGDDDIAKQLVDDIETTLPNAVADPKAWANSILDRRNQLPSINPPEGASEAAVAAAKEKRSKLVRAVVSIYSKAKAAAKEGQTDIRGRAIEAALTNNESRIAAASIMKQRLDSMRQSRKSRLKNLGSDPTLEMAMEKADYEPNLTTGGVAFKKMLVDAGLPEKQAQVAAIITDARARVASWKRGISTDEWYAARIEGVVKGDARGFTADALYQEALAANVDVSKLAVPEGFFSPLQRAIAKVIGDNNGRPVKSGYLLQQVKKQSGVKADELQWSGLEEFLQGKERVSLEEVTEWLTKREPVVEVKGITPSAATTPGKVSEAADRLAKADAALSEANVKAREFLEKYDLHISFTNNNVSTKPGEILDYVDQMLAGELPRDLDAQARQVFNKTAEWLRAHGDSTLGAQAKHTADNVMSDGRLPRPDSIPEAIRAEYTPMYNNWVELEYGQKSYFDYDTELAGEKIAKNPAAIQELRSLVTEITRPAYSEQQAAANIYYSLSDRASSATIFGHWVAPGPSANYREIRFIQPSIPHSGGTHHINLEPNAIAHIRTTDRTTEDGKKVLFVEEVQSDWHQAGAKEGYWTREKQAELDALEADRLDTAGEFDALKSEFARSNNADLRRWRAMADNGLNDSQDYTHPRASLEARLDLVDLSSDKPRRYLDLRDKIIARNTLVEEKAKSIRSGAHADTWRELALKQALIIAAREGYDGVALTRGPIIARVAGGRGVGGELSGQLSFYEELLPGTAASLAKKNGSRMETAQLNVGAVVDDEKVKELRAAYKELSDIDDYFEANPPEAWRVDPATNASIDPRTPEQVEKGNRKSVLEHRIKQLVGEDRISRGPEVWAKTDNGVSNVPFIPVTPAMTAKVESEGLPLFNRDTVNTPAFKRWFGDSKVVDADGKPLVVYHGSSSPRFDAFEVKKKSDGEYPGLVGDAVYFSTNPKSAAGWGTTLPGSYRRGQDEVPFGHMQAVYAKVERPLLAEAFDAGNPRVVAHKNAHEPPDDFMDALSAQLHRQDDEYAKSEGKADYRGQGYYFDLQRADPTYVNKWNLVFSVEGNTSAISDAAKQAGYDGFVIQHYTTYDKTGSDIPIAKGDVEVAVFSPEQVKSVNNNGAFNPNDPRLLYSRDDATAARLLEANTQTAALKAEVDDLTTRLAAAKKRNETLKSALAATKGSKISPDGLRSATIRLRAEMEAVKGDVEAIAEQLKAKKAAHADASKAATLAKKDDAAAEKVVVKADKKGESVPVTQARARLTAAKKEYNAAARQLSDAKIALADAVSSKAKPAEVKALKSSVEAAVLLERQKGDALEGVNELLLRTLASDGKAVTPVSVATTAPVAVKPAAPVATAPLPAAHGTPMGGVDPAVAPVKPTGPLTPDAALAFINDPANLGLQGGRQVRAVDYGRLRGITPAEAEAELEALAKAGYAEPTGKYSINGYDGVTYRVKPEHRVRPIEPAPIVTVEEVADTAADASKAAPTPLDTSTPSPETVAKVENAGQASEGALDTSRVEPVAGVVEGPSLPRGAVTFADDGRAVIHAFEGANVETFLHEVGHIMRRDLDADEAEAVVDWLRAQTGDNSLDIVDGKLIADDATTAEELFAEGFTAYLRTGVSPTANLQRAFSYLHSWLREIYKTVRGFFPQSVTPETAKMFDGLLSIDKSDEAIKKAMRMGIDPKATPNIIKRAYRELIGPALPQAPKTMDELAKAAQASGLDVTAEKLAAIMERDGKIDFPHPVAGKASYTEDDLRRFQASIERARTKAREEARLKMALSSPNEAVTEATPTEALWNRVSGDTNGSKLARAATAAFIGLDADLDLRAMPAHLRSFVKIGARNVEAAYSDGVKLLTERDPEKFRRWLAGTPTKLHNGRNAISSGYDMAGNVRMNARLAMASFSDKAREGARRAAFSTTSDAVGTLTEESRELVSKGVVEMLYATNSDFLKQLGEVLDIPGRNAGIGVVVNPRPQEVRLTGALHRFAHMDSDTLPAVDDLLDIVEDIYGPDKAARVGLLIAGHGAGHKVIQKWYNLGLTVSPKEAMVFQSWLHAEKMSPEDFKLAQRTAEKFGLDPRFVPVAGQFGTIHVPEAARKRLAAAMAKPTQESLNWLSSPNDIGRGIYKDTVKPGQAAYDLIGFFTRGLKAGMTRGNMFVSSWFNFANTIDHLNQVGGVAGFGAALATSQRLLAQDLLIFMPFLSRAADVGRRFGVLKPDAIEKMRRVLSEGGDRMSVLIQKVALANTCSVNTNKVLDGLDETVNLGGRWYNYKDIRQAYIDFGVAGSYAGELENALRKNLQPPASLAEKLGDRVADYMEYVEEMHEGLAERERVGAMLTFIEMGASPEDAARLAVAALFDYGSSVAAAERSAFLAIFFPFLAFQKNANAFTINNLLTPWGAYRIGAIRRMWEGSTEALSEIFYGTVADPYGIDNRALSDTGRANYYALRAELEAMYGGSEFVPDDVKLALRHVFGQLPAYMLGDGKISQLSEKLSAAVESSTQPSAGLNPLTGRPAMLDVAEAYLPKPDRATESSYNRDRPAITMTYAKTEAMKRYLSLAPDDHPFTELYLPENTIVSGLRHCLNLAAATVLLPQKLYAWGAGKIGEGGQDPEWFGINETRVAGPLTKVLDPDRSLLLPEISADLLGGAEAAPYRIHPFLGRIMEDSGLPLVTTDGKIDPFGLGTDASPEAVKENEALMANPTWTGRRKDDKNVAVISEKRYYAPGGLWSVAIKRTPGFHDLNRILLSTDQTTLEGAGGLRGDLLTTASTILGIPVSENIGDKSAAREEPRKPDENLNPNK